MKKISNIVSSVNDKLEYTFTFNEVINYYNYNTMSNIDLTLPTLFIGYYEVIKLYPDINILKRKINDNLFWTFKKNEKIIDHFEELKLFGNRVIEYYFNYYENISLNLVEYTINEINDLILKTPIHSIYENNRSIYFSNDENIIYSIDKQFINYVSSEYLKLIKKTLLTNEIIVINDKNCDIVNKYKFWFPENDEIIESLIIKLIV